MARRDDASVSFSDESSSSSSGGGSGSKRTAPAPLPAQRPRKKARRAEEAEGPLHAIILVSRAATTIHLWDGTGSPYLGNIADCLRHMGGTCSDILLFLAWLRGGAMLDLDDAVTHTGIPRLVTDLMQQCPDADKRGRFIAQHWTSKHHAAFCSVGIPAGGHVHVWNLVELERREKEGDEASDSGDDPSE